MHSYHCKYIKIVHIFLILTRQFLHNQNLPVPTFLTALASFVSITCQYSLHGNLSFHELFLLRLPPTFPTACNSKVTPSESECQTIPSAAPAQSCMAACIT